MMANAMVATARKKCAAPIGASPDEIIFTSGATESINLAIQGVATAAQLHRPNARKRIISVKSEHSAVRDAVARCANLGYDVQWVSVDHQGCVDDL
jgi:cysteine desulfurase